ncbi:MAG: AtpZ/AtpI family protein [Vicingaceae bacterium]
MKRPKKSPKQNLGSSREFIKYTNIALRMIVIILVGVYAGMKLDEYLAYERPYITMLLSVLSVGVAMWIIIRDISSK